MDIDAEVDKLFRKKRNVRKYIVAFGVFVATTILITLTVLPFFDEKRGFLNQQTPIQNVFDKATTGDESLNGSAYHYWQRKGTSFGIESMRWVNFSFWKQWLKKYFKYECEARPDNISQWQNANELLDVNLSFNETIGCKVTLTLNTTNAPKALYYRFTLVANRSVISHINKSVDYQYTLNLSANQTENYSLVYNYSDLQPYIESGKITIKQGIYQNYFYQRIKTNTKIAVNKSFVVDPQFGWTGQDSTTSTADDIVWENFTNTAGAGTIDNWYMYLAPTGGDAIYQGVIYNATGGTFIGNSTNVTALNGNAGWYEVAAYGTINVANNTDYVLGIAGNATAAALVGRDWDAAAFAFWRDNTVGWPNKPEPLVKDTTFSSYHLSVAVNFTESGISWQVIDDSINGTLYNISLVAWQVIDDTINGTLYNQTSWRDIDTSMNGTLYNQTIWHDIDTSINGTLYNSTVWRVIDESLNGTLYNQTQWRDIDTSINGTLYNQTIWRIIDDSINGTLYNISAIAWQVIDDSINGTLYNSTQWKVLDDSINGTIYNATTWHIIDDSINGTLYNESFYWKVIDDSINGTLYNISLPAPFNITDEYPSNQSFIYDLQPTLFFNLSHPSSNKMNYSVYIDNTTLISSGTNVTDGRFSAVDFYTATNITKYYWKVVANDGDKWVNASFHFTEDELAVKQSNWGLLGLLAIFGIIAFVFVIRRRNEWE